jgi:hypothetical protein
LIKGSAFIFNQGNYALEMKEENPCFIQPTELPLNLELAPNSCDFRINKEISCFIFNRSELYHFLSEDNKDKKYYNEGNISPSMAIVLSQLFHYSLHPSIKTCIKGTIAYLIEQKTQCRTMSVLIDEDNVLKIKKAKKSC